MCSYREWVKLQSWDVWAVVLSFALTEGALTPLIVSAVLGVGLIVWGSRLSRR